MDRAHTGGLQSMGSLGVGHDWATSLSLFPFMHWRRKWQPTSVFLPGESQGRGSLVGRHLWAQSWTRLKRLSSSSIETNIFMNANSHNSCGSSVRSYCPHFVDKEMEPQSRCLSLFKCSTGPDDLSFSVLLFFKATPVSSSPGSSAPYPSTKPVWRLSPLYPQITLCDFSWDNHHLPCSIFRHSPVHKKYPQQLQFTDLVVLPVEFKDKEVQSHGEPCCSRGSLFGGYRG